jgi:hypothetical protein
MRPLTCAGLVAIVACALPVPAAVAAPQTDSHGFVDSTARCASPDTAVAFGHTATSRVAICRSADGQYTYRGVRVTDGAKLIIPAQQSGAGYFAESEGVTYTVTTKSLTVSVGPDVIRDEQFFDFQQPAITDTAPSAPGSTPSTPPLPAEVGYRNH